MFKKITKTLSHNRNFKTQRLTPPSSVLSQRELQRIVIEMVG